MRVPLPGRDYFPPRVLLRGAARAVLAPMVAPMLDPGPEWPWREPRGGMVALRAGPGMVPASPPVPAIGMRPAAA